VLTLEQQFPQCQTIPTSRNNNPAKRKLGYESSNHTQVAFGGHHSWIDDGSLDKKLLALGFTDTSDQTAKAKAMKDHTDFGTSNISSLASFAVNAGGHVDQGACLCALPVCLCCYPQGQATAQGEGQQGRGRAQQGHTGTVQSSRQAGTQAGRPAAPGTGQHSSRHSSRGSTEAQAGQAAGRGQQHRSQQQGRQQAARQRAGGAAGGHSTGKGQQPQAGSDRSADTTAPPTAPK